MKKTAIALALSAFMLADLAAYAQKHLVFTKGVEIKGTKTEMVAALAKKGFKYEETNDGVPLMIGKFEGFSDSEVNIVSKAGTDFVCAIRAELPARISWVKLENDYSEMKARMKKRFGEPRECVEEFKDSPDGTHAKLVSLINNRCNYRTVYACDEGTVTLSLKHFGPICFVCVLFEDALGGSGNVL